MWGIGGAVAWACTGHVEARVVGWSADGQLGVVRYEHHDEGESTAIDLALIDVATAAEKKTWSILSAEDQGDAAVRGANWKKAEAELTAAGVTIDPSLGAKVFDGERPLALADGTELTLVRESIDGPTGDPIATLAITVVRDGVARRHGPFARWPQYTSVQAIHHVSGVWTPPNPRVVWVVAGPACVAPTIHPIPLDAAP